MKDKINGEIIKQTGKQVNTSLALFLINWRSPEAAAIIDCHMIFTSASIRTLQINIYSTAYSQSLDGLKITLQIGTKCPIIDTGYNVLLKG
jgi:hypothetical protein